jgi:hypothetical protein
MPKTRQIAKSSTATTIKIGLARNAGSYGPTATIRGLTGGPVASM